jgi:putative two-component system response regulator
LSTAFTLPPTADILVVDDTVANLQFLTGMLKNRGHKVRPVPGGRLALQAARSVPPDLILLDINMPEMNGYEVCSQLKADPALRDIPVIFISANGEVIDKVKAFAIGGVDYVTKPFQFEEVAARVETHLKIRGLQIEIGALNQTLLHRVHAQVQEISDSQLATILALATLAESRDHDTGSHILRVQRYSQVLAGRLARDGVFGDQIDAAFVETIFHASAMHDIGKVGIPDQVLLKQGPLNPEEWQLMKAHTVLGADTLTAVLNRYPNNVFIRTGRDIARSHHEFWDGSGYPDGRRGEEIPLAARIVLLADQYDARRNKRPYKQAFDAAKAFAILTQGDARSSPSHLDPRVLAAFVDLADEFNAIFEESHVGTQ